MKHSLKWFKRRIGKRIYSYVAYQCECIHCKKVRSDGCIVWDNDTAEYFYAQQYEMDREYSDKERNK